MNRTAENPVVIEVWSDLALPLTVDGAVRWDDVRAAYEADMAADGIGLERAPNMAACWPGVWATTRVAERWREKRTDTPIPIRDLLHKGWGICAHQDRRPLAFRYQHHGERQKWRRGWHLPDVVADPRGWLETRLGALRGFEIVSRG